MKGKLYNLDADTIEIIRISAFVKNTTKTAIVISAIREYGEKHKIEILK